MHGCAGRWDGARGEVGGCCCLGFPHWHDGTLCEQLEPSSHHHTHGHLAAKWILQTYQAYNQIKPCKEVLISAPGWWQAPLDPPHQTWCLGSGFELHGFAKRCSFLPRKEHRDSMGTWGSKMIPLTCNKVWPRDCLLLHFAVLGHTFLHCRFACVMGSLKPNPSYLVPAAAWEACTAKGRCREGDTRGDHIAWGLTPVTSLQHQYDQICLSL